MENEGEPLGEITVCSAEWVFPGAFALCTRIEGKIRMILQGSLTELGDSFVANGEAIRLSNGRTNVLFVFNPYDFDNNKDLIGKFIE